MNMIMNNKLIKQIIKFGIVGGLAFLIDYLILFLLTDVVGIYYLISSIISFIVSVVFNYILSIIWVFDVNKKQTVKEFLIFIILSAIGLLINLVIMYLLVDIANIYYMFAKIVSTAVVMVYNFITRKKIIEK